MNTHQRMLERYTNKDVPWDDTLPPPEVIELAQSLPPGRSLDLGCGYGRTTLYLAEQGWQADGVDFVDLAIEEARRRAESRNIQANFHVGDVSDLAQLSGLYQLIVDVGCVHGLPAERFSAYHQGLKRLSEAGSHYLLFARIYHDDAPAEDRPGLDEALLKQTFADGFVLEKTDYGETHMPDASWASAWYWFKRV